MLSSRVTPRCRNGRAVRPAASKAKSPWSAIACSGRSASVGAVTRNSTAMCRVATLAMPSHARWAPGIRQPTRTMPTSIIDLGQHLGWGHKWFLKPDGCAAWHAGFFRTRFDMRHVLIRMDTIPVEGPASCFPPLGDGIGSGSTRGSFYENVVVLWMQGGSWPFPAVPAGVSVITNTDQAYALWQRRARLGTPPTATIQSLKPSPGRDEHERWWSAFMASPTSWHCRRAAGGRWTGYPMGLIRTPRRRSTGCCNGVGTSATGCARATSPPPLA